MEKRLEKTCGLEGSAFPAILSDDIRHSIEVLDSQGYMSDVVNGKFSSDRKFQKEKTTIVTKKLGLGDYMRSKKFQ